MSESTENGQTVAVKEESESIELKSDERSAMPLTCVADEPTETGSAPHLPQPSKLTGLEPSSAPFESPKSSNPAELTKSRGLFRHRLVLAGSIIIAMGAFAITAFDLSFLISQSGTIDRKFNFSADVPNPELPESMGYLEPLKHDKLRPIYEGQVAGGKQGFADDEGHVVIPPIYYSVKSFSEGLAAVKKDWDGKWGYIDTSGTMVIPDEYAKASFFHNGYARVLLEENDKETALLIDRTGLAVDLKTLKPVREAHGFFVVKAGAMTGLMRGSKLIIPAAYDDINLVSPKFSNEKYSTDASNPSTGESKWAEKSAKPYFKLSKGGKCGLADSDGQVLFSPRYHDILNVANGHAVVVADDGRIGISDLSGNLVVPTEYNRVTRFDQLIALGKRGAKVKFIDSTGKPVTGLDVDNIRFDFDTLQWLHDGMGVIKKNGLFGYVDASGRVIIPPKYVDAQAFDGGVARVGDGSSTIYIDRLGNQVSPQSYVRASQFLNGKADVTIRGPLANTFADASRYSSIVHRASNGSNKIWTNFEADDFEAEQ